MNDTEALHANILSLGEWATWEDCMEKTIDTLQPWLERVDAGRFRRVLITGCGSSYYAGQVGRYYFERLAGLPGEAAQAFTFSHYANPDLLGEDTLVIGVSSTGKTPATCAALDFARKAGAATLAITGVPGSKITESAGHTVWMGGGDDTLVKTRSFVQSLIALHILAFHLGEKRGRLQPGQKEQRQEQIRLAHAATRDFLENGQERLLELVEEALPAQQIFILGSGPNTGTAEEGALKVIEMAKLTADGCDMEDFFHGRDRELAPGSHVFFLAPQGAAAERMLDFLTFTRKVSVPTAVLSDRVISELERLTERQIVLNPVNPRGLLDELTTPMVYITPLYLFSYHLGLKRGYEPNARRFPMGALYVSYRGSEFEPSSRDQAD